MASINRKKQKPLNPNYGIKISVPFEDHFEDHFEDIKKEFKKPLRLLAKMVFKYE